MDEVDDVLQQQDQVIARSQALDAGLGEAGVARRLRRREWVAVHPGVYVAHTGPLTWRQRAWAAVLACWPAALSGRSAMRAHEGPGRRGADQGVIEVVVAHHRRIRSPPRLRYVASGLCSPTRSGWADRSVVPSRMGGVAVLTPDVPGSIAGDTRGANPSTDPASSRRAWRRGSATVGASGVSTATPPPRPPRRGRWFRWIPPGPRDGRCATSSTTEAAYTGRQVLELDGRLFHDSVEARDRDMERDLDTAVDGAETVRIGYGQVFERPCTTAAKIARLLRRRGWRGTPKRCPDCPPDAVLGGVA